MEISEIQVGATGSGRSVHAFVLVVPETLDLVLQQQFSSFQFRNFQIIDRGMRLAIVYLFAECPVLLFKFRKMRLHRHTECHLNLWVLMMMLAL